MKSSLCLALCAAALTTAACERPAAGEREREMVARTLPTALSYPHSTVARVSAGSDAAELTLVAPAPADVVLAWYRQFLQLNGWQTLSDASRGDGTTVLHAVKDGRPLWVTVHANVGGPGTTYTLVGAIVEADSTP